MNEPENQVRSETWRTWLPPVIAAVLTATLGVTASAVIESCNRERDAENAALVLDHNLQAANDAMVRSLKDNRYRFYNLKLDMPLEDQKRLADELGNDYGDVAAASAAYRLQFARAAEEHEFVQFDRVQLACIRVKIARGRRALRDLTEAPELPDVEDLERRCEDEEAKLAAEQAAAQAELAAEQYYDNFVHARAHPEHSPSLHPHSNAAVDDLEGDLRSATVSLNDAGGNRIGRLLLKDRSGEWQVDEVIQRLEPVRLRRGSAEQGKPSTKGSD